jgi:hypothetical protein
MDSHGGIFTGGSRINDRVAGRLEEAARLLAEQGADRYRIGAYRRAAESVRRTARGVDAIYHERGLPGLQDIAGVGETIARAIRELVIHGRLPMLERLRGEADPVALLSSVPGVGRVFANRLHDELGLDTLADLEAAAHDGRLASIAGFGEKRIAGIRDSLAYRLDRVRGAAPRTASPDVAELLDVDREYHTKAAAGLLRRIAPRRFNPDGNEWLPILHTVRNGRHYTALFSNTARAHRAGKTRDWVVLYHDAGDGERQHTVITATHGALRDRRVVAGREAECLRHYSRNAA